MVVLHTCWSTGTTHGGERDKIAIFRNRHLLQLLRYRVILKSINVILPKRLALLFSNNPLSYRRRRGLDCFRCLFLSRAYYRVTADPQKPPPLCEPGILLYGREIKLAGHVLQRVNRRNPWLRIRAVEWIGAQHSVLSKFASESIIQ